jgi:hypothetical protein
MDTLDELVLRVSVAIDRQDVGKEILSHLYQIELAVRLSGNFVCLLSGICLVFYSSVWLFFVITHCTVAG